MAQEDVDSVWQYVGTESIAHDLRDELSYYDYTEEEIIAAASEIAKLRAQNLVDDVVEVLETKIQAEAQKVIWWETIKTAPDDARPKVIYFPEGEDLPLGFLESNLYVCFKDFQAVMYSVNTTPEPLAALYHTLVLYFADEPEVVMQAIGSLRYNPQNQASWRDDAYTHRFFISRRLVHEHSKDKVDEEHRIKGVGTKGRKIMREVIWNTRQRTA